MADKDRKREPVGQRGTQPSQASDDDRNPERSRHGPAEAAARQGTQAGMSATGEAAQDVSGQAERMVRQLAETAEVYRGVARRIAEEVRALAGAPVAAAGGAQDLARAWAEWLQRTMQANARFAREALSARSLPEAAQAHARFVEESLSGLREGGARVLAAATGGVARRALGSQEGGEAGGAEGGRERRPLTVADVMTPHVRVARPEQTAQEAAAEMARADVGVLPVLGEGDRIVGMLTDRDLTMRVVAAGKDPASTTVQEAMTPGAEYCLTHAEVEGLAAHMAELRLQRLPVLDQERRLVGIVSISDLATGLPDPELAGRALGGIAQERGPHRQRPAAAAARAQASDTGRQQRRQQRRR